jgi:signal transduction histidine kinase
MKGPADDGAVPFGVWLADSVNRATAWAGVLCVVVLLPPVLIAAAIGPRAPIVFAAVLVAVITGCVGWLSHNAWRSQPPTSAVRVLWATTIIALLGYAWLAEPVPGTVAWPWQLAPSIAALCVLGWQSWRALVAGVVIAVTYGGVRVTSVYGGHSVAQATAEVLLCFMLVAATSVAAVGLQRSLRTREAGEREARLAVAQAEQMASAVHLQGHWSAVVHDSVLSVLAAAANLTDGPVPIQVRADARRARDQLGEPPEMTPCRAGDLAAWVATTATSIVVRPLVRDQIDDRRRWIPGPVAAAVLAAGAQAMHNAVRHGGGDVEVTIRDSSGGVIELIVADSGEGFDPGRIPPGRLGLRVAVAERMALIGGRGSWWSAPGRGAVVTLSWPRNDR